MKPDKIIQVNQESQENRADVVIVNGKAFTYKNSGLTRRVFVNKDKTLVVKIPVGKYSQHFNDEELECWESASDDVKKELANTKRLENGYIIQEYLHTIDDEITGEWLNRPMTMKEIRFASSCRDDVGYDKDGNLKCYDLHEYKKY